MYELEINGKWKIKGEKETGKKKDNGKWKKKERRKRLVLRLHLCFLTYGERRRQEVGFLILKAGKLKKIVVV
jgi:hypothetical protein